MIEKRTVSFNYVMNLLIKVSGGLFSFLSYPYAFRILGADHMGEISFATSFSALFAMAAVLGVPIYGIRECARVRDDRQALAATVSELLAIQGIATACSLLVYGISVGVVPQLRSEWLLHMIQAAAILAGAMNVEWVFSAREDFGYIASRTMIVKGVMTAGIFLFVRKGSDYVLYALLLAAGSIVTNGMNLARLLRAPWIGPVRRPKALARHMGPVATFFIQTIAITVYTSMDSVMLYFFRGEHEAGVYDAAVKGKLFLSYLITGLSTVLMPKLSYFAANEQRGAFWQTVTKAAQFTVTMSLPLILFFEVMAGEAMAVISGTNEGTMAFRILLPTVLLIGCSSMAGNQILTPMRRERTAMYAYLWGAGVNVALNLICIPRWSMAGAAAATLAAEMTVLGVELFALRNDLRQVTRAVAWKKTVLAAVLPVPLLAGCGIWITGQWQRLMAGAAVYGLCWLSLSVLMKEPFCMEIWNRAKGICKKLTPPKQFFLCCAGIAALSLVVMAVYGGRHGFWYDEFAQLCYSAPPKTILETALIADYTPPLFSIAANLWMRMAPYGEGWFLLLPQLAVAGAAIVTGLWCRERYGFFGGVLGAAWIAFSQLVMEQCGFEFRGYGFYLFFAALVFYLRQRKARPAVYALGLTMLAYCHIFGVLMCIALGLWDGALILRKKLTWKGIAPYVAAGGCFLPWGIYFLSQIGESAMGDSASWMAKPSIWEAVKLIAFLCGNHIVICALFAAGVLAAVAGAVRKRKTADGSDGEQAVPVFVGAFLIGVVFLYGMIRADGASLWVKRYFIGLYPCATVLAVGGADRLMQRWKKCAPVMTAALLLLTVPFWMGKVIADDAPFGIHYQREAAQILLEEAEIYREDTLVLSTQGMYVDGWAWMYLYRGDVTGGIQVASVEDISPKDLVQYKTLYVENGFAGYTDVPAELIDYLEEHFRQAESWPEYSLTKYVSPAD